MAENYRGGAPAGNELTLEPIQEKEVKADAGSEPSTLAPGGPVRSQSPSGGTGGQSQTAKRKAEEETGVYRFQFTGTGGEYFRIWVVNLLLTIVTLGVYSAWAKVRRQQYFYRNTRFAGAIFDYHGNPKAILKGRILAVALVGGYKIASMASHAAAGLLILVGVLILPWLLSRSFRFKLSNSSYRGLRFRFVGTVGGAYRTLSLLPAILAVIGYIVWTLGVSFASHPGMILTVGLVTLLALAAAVPYAHYLLKRYQHDNAYFGSSPFFFHAGAWDFFKIYLRAVRLSFLGWIPAAIFGFLTHKIYVKLAATSLGWLFTMLYGVVSAYASYLLVRPFMESRTQNLVWNSTDLAGLHFVSEVEGKKLFWIHAANLILITLTLGLYKPFAAIRLYKYRVECLKMVTDENLDDFLADHAAAEENALGQEAGDLLDIDIAL